MKDPQVLWICTLVPSLCDIDVRCTLCYTLYGWPGPDIMLCTVAALIAGEALRTCTLVSTPYHWTFQMLWVLYWLTICLLVTFTTWLLVVQPVRSAKRAAKARCTAWTLCMGSATLLCCGKLYTSGRGQCATQLG